MMDKKYGQFSEFWPDYVRAHQHSLTRRLHFGGTTNLIFWLLLALFKRSPKLFVWAIMSSYSLAWIGHFFVEGNKPLTFKYPIKSAFGDLLMYFKIWRGEMDDEVKFYCRSQQVMKELP